MSERRSPIVTDIHAFQTIEAHQIYQLGITESPKTVLSLLKGEVSELEEALCSQDKGEIASEIADVIILSTRIASMHHIPLELALSDKLDRNAHKYNPYKARRLQDSGYGADESMSILKALWERTDDKKFCRVCGR